MAALSRPCLAAALIGVAAGFVLASLLHAYPKDQTTRHRYCQRCAEYEETCEEGVILGGTRRLSEHMTGPFHDLLGPQLQQHEHEFTPWATIHPTFGVEPEHPEVADRIRQLRVSQQNAQTVSALEQAMRNDAPRTTSLLHRVLDPSRPYPAQAIVALHRDAPWTERWDACDAALEALDRAGN